MPTKKPVNNTQDLRTSNLTSNLFLGGSQRPWMCAGPSGSAAPVTSEIDGSRRVNVYNEQISSNHNNTVDEVSDPILGLIAKSNSAKTPQSGVRQDFVRHDSQGTREEQMPTGCVATNENVRALTTTMTDGSELVQSAVSGPVATAINLNDMFPAQSFTPSSKSPAPEVQQHNAHPPQSSSTTAQETLSRPHQLEKVVGTTPAGSEVSALHSFQFTQQNRGCASSTQDHSQAEEPQITSNATMVNLSFPSPIHSVSHDQSTLDARSHARTATSTQLRPSEGHTPLPMTQSNEIQLTMSRSPNMSPVTQRLGQQPSKLASAGSALAFLPAFDRRIDSIRQKHNGPLNSVSEGRILWVRVSCQCDDLYFLLLHQIYCLWSSKREWLWSKLGFGSDQEDGFQCLELLMVSNLALPPELLEFFGVFINSCAVLENEPTLKSWVGSIREFLRGFSPRWNALRQLCMARASPPCTWEICWQLNFTKSSVLQRACFDSLRRQLFPFASAAYVEEITKVFDEDQKVFLARLEQGTLNSLQYLDVVKTFARHCNFIKEIYGPEPAHVSDPTSPNLFCPTALLNNHGNLSQHIFDKDGDAQLHRPRVLLATQRPTSQPFATLVVDCSRPQAGDASMDPRGQMVHTVPGFLPSQVHQVPSSEGLRSVHSMTGTRRDLPPNQNQQLTDNERSNNRAMLPRFDTNNLFTNPQSSNTHQAGVSSRFFPAPNFRLPILANPNPDTGALHQAHLRSPRLVSQKLPESSSPRRYCYLQSFLLAPQMHTTDCSFSSWTFELPLSLATRIVKDFLPAADDVLGPTTRNLVTNSILTSLKCIQLPAGQASVDANSWSSLPTRWPECGFFSLNNAFIELRRKIHYRKDLPADVTSVVQSGVNKLCFSYILDPKEAGKKFAIALEMINVSDHQSALDAPTRIDARTSLETIQAKLKPDCNGNDDDLLMVDAYICIDLVDPFTSQVFVTPVRGLSCLHRECFDLESFLQSRPSRNKNGVISPDEWLCPICKRDARPTSLVIDEFLLQVRNQLVEQDKMDVRAILVREDGSWEPKTETAGVALAKDGIVQHRTITNTATGNASEQKDSENISKPDIRAHSTTPMIIDLMDD